MFVHINYFLFWLLSYSFELLPLLTFNCNRQFSSMSNISVWTFLVWLRAFFLCKGSEKNTSSFHKQKSLKVKVNLLSFGIVSYSVKGGTVIFDEI